MPSCTFFGHRDCPDSIRFTIRRAIIELILEHGVNMFYVGNQGRFDELVLSELRMIQSVYPHMDYAVVLSHLPEDQNFPLPYAPEETMFPEGVESVHPGFAISRRNDWMLKQADFVVSYVIHSWGGAAKYTAKARRMNKNIFHIVKNDPQPTP